jgi:hypothetical protein
LLTAFGCVEASVGSCGEVHGELAGFGGLWDVLTEIGVGVAEAGGTGVESDDAVAGEGVEAAMGDGETLGFMEPGSEAVP